MSLSSTRSLHLKGTKPTVLAAYKFNEGAGTSTVDATGNGHDGTLTGAAGFGPGKYGTGILFSGGGQTVDFSYVGLQPARLGVSWCCWAKFPAAGRPSYLGIFCKIAALGGSTRNGVAIEAGGFFNVSRWRNQLDFATSGTAPSDEDWHFYAFSDGDNKLSLWLDGVVVRTVTKTGLPADTNNTAWENFPWQLGAATEDFNSMAGLAVSDLRILSGEMNTGDVLHYMNTPC